MTDLILQQSSFYFLSCDIEKIDNAIQRIKALVAVGALCENIGELDDDCIWRYFETIEREALEIEEILKKVNENKN